MSSLLSALDNNRSEDEDDQINRLFPKCKPRASSLSLSPSLQHMSHYDSTSTTNTTTSSTSELCLNSTRTSSATDLLLSQSPPPPPLTNNSLLLISPNNGTRNNDNTFGTSTNNNNKNTFEHALQPRRSQHVITNDLHQQKHHRFSSSNDALVNSSWSNQPSEKTRGLPSSSFHHEQICNNQTACNNSSSYDNNNVVLVNKHLNTHQLYNYNNQHQKNSSSSSAASSDHHPHSRCVVGSSTSTNLRKSASGTTFSGTESSISGSSSLQQSKTSSTIPSARHKNKCESNSNFGHKNVSRNQSNKGKVSQLHQNNNINGISQHRIHHHPHHHHHSSHSSGTQHHHHVGNSGSSTTSSHLKREKARGNNITKDCITKGMECRSSTTSGSTIEDTFDNGIGSRSSGESSDLMENLVSPTVSLRNNTSSTITSPTATAATNTTLTNNTTLRDSRIEIAGGREVYSQNRIRATRRHRGVSSGGHTHNNIISSSSCNSISTSSQGELIMTDTQGIPSSCGGGKVRKKSQAQGLSSSSSHSHSSYTQQQQGHHHCCHSTGPPPPPPPPCCSVSGEVGGIPAVVWEPNQQQQHPHSTCSNSTTSSSRRSGQQQQQQYIPPSHTHHCTGVKSTPHPCGCSCCAGHHSYPQEYSNAPSSTATGQTIAGALFSPHDFSRSGGGPPSTSTPTSAPTQMTIRETLFASEVSRSSEKKHEEKSKGLVGGGLVHVSNYTKELLKETSTAVPSSISPSASTGTSAQDPVIYEGVVGDGKVVFDDIGVVEWKEDDNPVECGYDGGDELVVHHDDLNESIQRKRQLDVDMSVGECCSISNSNPSRICNNSSGSGGSSGGGFHNNVVPVQLIEGSPCTSNRDGNTTPSGYESDDGSNPNTNSSTIVVNSDNATIISKGSSANFGVKRIGSIPIADYEGSPKRYGLKQSSSSHFDVLDEILDTNGSGNGGLLSQDSSSGTSLIDQTIVGAAAGTSSSSSSLDNTNTNVSSNSSSRTNNRISPRALSPASQHQHLHQQPPSSRFPGFPQRVSSTTSSSNNASSAPYHSSHHHHHHQHNHSHQQQQQHLQSHSNELTGSGHVVVGGSGFMGDGKCQREEPCVLVNSGNTISSNYTRTNTNGKDHEELEPGLIKPLPCKINSVEVETTTTISRGDRNGGGGGTAGIKTLGGDVESGESSHNISEPCSVPGNNTSSSSSTTARNQQQDMLLYEFSETRKVLEEFFNATGEMSLADKATFDELDYTLKRQAGNSYVGQRLAGDLCGELGALPPCGGAEDSPKKPPRRGVLLLSAGTTSDGDEDGSDLEKGSPKLISFQEISLPQQQTQQSQLTQHSSPPHHTSLSQQHHNNHHPHHPHHHHNHPQHHLSLHHHQGGGRCSGGVQQQQLLQHNQPSSRSPRSVKSHSRSQSQSPPPHDPTRDINDNDIDVETASTNTETDLGDTEVGLQVGHSRNFTLSPETTDCDSNELESELSLDYEASVHSSSRVGVTMPVVEDGLSSGNESENEDIIEVDIGYSHHHHHHLHSNNHLHHQHHNHHLHHDPTSFYVNNDTKMIMNNPFTNSGSGKMESNGGSGTGGLSMENNKGIFKPANNGNPFFNIDGIPSNLLDWNISGNTNSEDLKLNASVIGLIEDSNNSDSNNESNATVMLMKKQISEIEKEIQLRATAQQQQCQRLGGSQSDGGSGLDMDGGVPSDLNNDEANEEINFCVGESHQKNSFRANGFSSSSTATNGNNSGVSNISHKGPLVGGSNCTSKNSSNQVVVVGDSSSGGRSTGDNSQTSQQPPPSSASQSQPPSSYVPHDPELDALDPMRPTPPPSPAPGSIIRQQQPSQDSVMCSGGAGRAPGGFLVPSANHQPGSLSFDRMGEMSKMSTSSSNSVTCGETTSPPSVTVTAAIQDIKEAIQRTKPLPLQQSTNTRLPPDHLHHQPTSNSTVVTSNSVPTSSSSAPSSSLPPASSQNTNPRVTHQYQHTLSSQERAAPLICDSSPVWIPRHASNSGRMLDHRSSDNSSGVRDPLLKKQRYDDTGDDDADTDQETDRLLGQTRTEDDYGFYDEKDWKKTKSRSLLPAINKGVAFVKSATTSVPSPHLSTSASSLSSAVTNNTGSANNNAATTNTSSNLLLNHSSSNSAVIPSPPNNSSSVSKSLSPSNPFDESQVQLPSSAGSSSVASKSNKKEKDGVKKKRSKEDILNNPTVLIEGVLFRARYLGSTQLVCEGQQPTKATRMMQAEEAVSRIKQTSVNGTVTSDGQGSSLKGSIILSTPSAAVAPLPSPLTTTNLSSPSDQSLLPPSKIEEVDDVYGVYPEDDESCCEDDESLCEDGDEDLLEPSPQHSTSSLQGSSSNNNNKGGIHRRLPPFEDIHGSANALHDEGGSGSVGGAISLHHNRTGGSGISIGGSSSGGVGGSCEAFPTTGTSAAQSPSFLNISPPYGSALPGTMFRLRFIGSLEVDEEIGSGKRRRKRPKKTMVEEAVMKMKAPEGETQPSTEVDLFISTEKIMVLNTDLKEIMMDHALRTISYIADIGDLVVLMARRRPVPTDTVDESKPPRPPKMICHVFESDEAQYIAQSIGQAFQVAYMEFLKANGIEDSSFVREMDYQEVLNSQEIFGDELQMFAKKELQKEVVVPKTKGEILGVVIVESGWGSMLPTVVIANLAPSGAAARCGQLNIGDQIIAINGVSLVGLPLSTCQNYIKNTKTQTVVKLTVVPCPPVVEVKIKRPDTKYQLGFSVQNGVICSLLRGGIAERGGVRVGHRIIEINSQSVVAVPHEKIVNLLATSVGEINMKTMPTSMFRLLTGQETPLYI